MHEPHSAHVDPHVDGVAPPDLGWDLVQHDWGIRQTEPRPPSRWLAAARRVWRAVTRWRAHPAHGRSTSQDR